MIPVEDKPASLPRDVSSGTVALVVPAYNVENELPAVLTDIPTGVQHVIVVDDGSTDGTSRVIDRYAADDDRIVKLGHPKNRGVGAAMQTGFKKALELEADFVVKVDGDGQMPLESLPSLLRPLQSGAASFAKGNRFRDFGALRSMPLLRRIGNAALSFLAKAATGYWNTFDPTNGYFAMRRQLLAKLPLDSLDTGYFFEISLLSELYFLNAEICEVPMPARYGSETSNLSIVKTLIEFPPKLIGRLVRRLVLKYFLYDFSMVSVYLLVGMPMLLFGLVFGSVNWVYYSQRGITAPTGTVMLATLPVIVGVQVVLAAIGEDLRSAPACWLEAVQ
jgi:glycosyltransferase involved in cell wall biosynthesis